MDLVGGWNALMEALGVTKYAVPLSAAGVAIIVFFTLKWLWAKKRGKVEGKGSFPWAPVLVGGVIAAPAVIVPILLLLAQAFLGFGMAVLAWLASRAQ